jgi:hypothetical protein
MDRYGLSGPTAATAATVDNAIFQIWNPSTTRSIFVKEIHLFKTTAGAADIPNIRRTSAKGTVTTSFVSAIEADFSHGLAPPSVAEINLVFSGQPTFAGTSARGLAGVCVPAAIGAGLMWVFEEPITVKSATGLCVCTGSGLAFPVSIATAIIVE